MSVANSTVTVSPWQFVAPENVADVVLKLVVSFILAFVIGLERSVRHKPAGIRTHVLVAMGSTLFTITGMQIVPANGTNPARVIANIAPGIGFIGAGVIMKSEDRVMGLTTAASLWLTAAVGVAVGLGLYLTALMATLLGLLVLLLRPVESYLVSRFEEWEKRRTKSSEQ
jgi:putative Mg2+ transporter-C (MgtC) family protein